MSANTSLKPPNHEAVREVVEARLATANTQGLPETLSVEWRGQQLIIPVVTMPVELLYFNPNTHRIRAQMTVDPASNAALACDPFGDTAQRYLHKLLAGDPADPAKEDPTFAALKEDLRKHYQRDAGIVTRDGVLINGNTRCAALRDLHFEHMRVGVLPADAGMEDLQSIELSLQLRKDHKRDYSFMNFLLAIDDRRKANRPPASIQKDFRIRPDTYERAVWILDFVREAIKRSEVNVGGGQAALSLIDFERDQGKLEELWRAYVALKRKSPDDAEALREQRLLGLILGGSKTDLRLIEPNFADLYLDGILSAVAAPPSAEPRIIPGTNIQVPAESAKVAALRDLTNQVLRATAIERSPDAATPREIQSASESINKLKVAVKKGFDQAGASGRLIKRRFGPVERLSDANEDLALCIKAVAEGKGTGNFVADDLDQELRQTMMHLSKLAQMIGVSPEGCDGLDWLLEASQIAVRGA